MPVILGLFRGDFGPFKMPADRACITNKKTPGWWVVGGRVEGHFPPSISSLLSLLSLSLSVLYFTLHSLHPSTKKKKRKKEEKKQN